MTRSYQILIVGGGAAGLATAASLHNRDRSLEIAIVEPADKHYYQPGWTMVGAGIFQKEETCRDMDSVWPAGVERIRNAVKSFDPKNNTVTLNDKTKIGYEILIVASGLKLDWDAIEGMTDSLGHNLSLIHI